jgi:hypothetical protein
MNKREIVNKLRVDLTNANHLIEKELVSFDSKVSLEAVVGYIKSLLERIEQEGKV